MKPLELSNIKDLLDDHSLFIGSNGSNGKKIRLEGCMIDNYNFQQHNFESVIMTKSSFRLCIFDELDLYDSILSHSTFEDCKFKNCMLSMANMVAAKFINTIFVNCNLVKSEAIGSSINNCVFYKCNLKLFDTSSADIQNTKFIENEFTDGITHLNKKNGNIIWA